MNGILIVDKPEGFTSFDVVAKLRGILHERKIGHGGTLDPMATGVLPVFVGSATKLCDFLPHDDKVYEARMLLGIRTDTEDTTGQILETGGFAFGRRGTVRDKWLYRENGTDSADVFREKGER